MASAIETHTQEAYAEIPLSRLSVLYQIIPMTKEHKNQLEAEQKGVPAELVLTGILCDNSDNFLKDKIPVTVTKREKIGTLVINSNGALEFYSNGVKQEEAPKEARKYFAKLKKENPHWFNDSCNPEAPMPILQAGWPNKFRAHPIKFDKKLLGMLKVDTENGDLELLIDGKKQEIPQETLKKHYEKLKEKYPEAVYDPLKALLVIAQYAIMHAAGYNCAKKISPAKPLFSLYLTGNKLRKDIKSEMQLLQNARNLPEDEYAFTMVSYLLDKVDELGLELYKPLLKLYDSITGKTRDYDKLSIEDFLDDKTRTLSDFRAFIYNATDLQAAPFVEWKGKKMHGGIEYVMTTDRIKAEFDKYYTEVDTKFDSKHEFTKEKLESLFGPGINISKVKIYAARPVVITNDGTYQFIEPKLRYNAYKKELSLLTDICYDGKIESRTVSTPVNWDKLLLAFNAAKQAQLF